MNLEHLMVIVILERHGRVGGVGGRDTHVDPLTLHVP